MPRKREKKCEKIQMKGHVELSTNLNLNLSIVFAAIAILLQSEL